MRRYLFTVVGDTCVAGCTWMIFAKRLIALHIARTHPIPIMWQENTGRTSKLLNLWHDIYARITRCYCLTQRIAPRLISATRPMPRRLNGNLAGGGDIQLTKSWVMSLIGI